ncbi:hypothetical protein BD410DRAFT_764142 [Rickenella mellea]|uniref:histone acetyltransferase n=1 Tax=Rickenella mellea TaxID=50990 RepID=A0A4Y7QFP7_9AGAM|nr:hypothetical protein BD410DRAFT_764142 [Rickenella mellea]
MNVVYYYPAAYDLSILSQNTLNLKIARHSKCSACNSCSGLHPSPDLTVVLDYADPSIANLNFAHDQHRNYLTACVCGHSVSEHVGELDKEELARRGRVAVRLDEELFDKGKLLEFDYIDEDISSLRLQMTLPASASSPLSPSTSSPEPEPISPTKHLLSPGSSALSDAPQPPAKRQRFSHSISSLSDAEEDDKEDEEDQPLASRVPLTSARTTASAKTRPEQGARATKHRAGKKASSMHSVAQTAPTSQSQIQSQNSPLTNGRVNGTNAHDGKVKVEDSIDENKLTRLATGVTVDTGVSAPTPSAAKPEKAVNVELRQGLIQVTAVENDKTPRSLVILTGLKTLFQKQLPKMPREYIARLVYDANSKSLAIIKWGYKVVGGICYRPFPQRGFAEIVFFATASVDQVKGYGGMLMNHFKAHIRNVYPTMLHFLTYADNYAVGYFRKQGFSKQITLDRAVWAGYIKDYEGGTIMQCTMLPKVDYLQTAELLGMQRDAILTKIRQMSKSHVVYEGIKNFGENGTVDAKDVPGLRETGWTPSMQTETQRALARSPQYAAMRRILTDLQGHSLAWAFVAPVNGDEVPDYYSVIKNPMDLSTMEHKLETNQYHTVDAFVADAQLIFRNCKTYNPETSIYYRNATTLEKHLKDLVDKIVLD